MTPPTSTGTCVGGRVPPPLTKLPVEQGTRRSADAGREGGVPEGTHKRERAGQTEKKRTDLNSVHRRKDKGDWARIP